MCSNVTSIHIFWLEFRVPDHQYRKNSFFASVIYLYVAYLKRDRGGEGEVEGYGPTVYIPLAYYPTKAPGWYLSSEIVPLLVWAYMFVVLALWRKKSNSVVWKRFRVLSILASLESAILWPDMRDPHHTLKMEWGLRQADKLHEVTRRDDAHELTLVCQFFLEKTEGINFIVINRFEFIWNHPVSEKLICKHNFVAWVS